MRERRLSVLLAEDHMQISFWLRINLLKMLLCLQVFLIYDCGVIEGRFARTKTSLSDFSFPGCKIQSVAV